MAGHPVKVTSVHPGGIKTAIARNIDAAEGLDSRRLPRFRQEAGQHHAGEGRPIILDGVRKNKARVLVGSDAKVFDIVVRATGSGYPALPAEGPGPGRPPDEELSVLSTAPAA